MVKTEGGNSMTSGTGSRQKAFTLLEMAVVMAIIFFLVSTLVIMIPRIELRAAARKAEGDIRRLELALNLHFQIKGWYPPDNLAHFRNYGPLASPAAPTPWIYSSPSWAGRPSVSRI